MHSCVVIFQERKASNFMDDKVCFKEMFIAFNTRNQPKEKSLPFCVVFHKQIHFVLIIMNTLTSLFLIGFLLMVACFVPHVECSTEGGDTYLPRTTYAVPLTYAAAPLTYAAPVTYAAPISYAAPCPPPVAAPLPAPVTYAAPYAYGGVYAAPYAAPCPPPVAAPYAYPYAAPVTYAATPVLLATAAKPC